MSRDRRRFANFFFGWDLDVVRTRLIYYEVLDVSGRNIQYYGRSMVHYVRWVEQGYRSELMRLTDCVNSMRVETREQLMGLTHLKPMRPSEELMNVLWSLVKMEMNIEKLYYWYGMGRYEIMKS